MNIFVISPDFLMHYWSNVQKVLAHGYNSRDFHSEFLLLSKFRYYISVFDPFWILHVVIDMTLVYFIYIYAISSTRNLFNSFANICFPYYCPFLQPKICSVWKVMYFYMWGPEYISLENIKKWEIKVDMVSWFITPVSKS